MYVRYLAHVREQRFRLDGLDHGLDRGAGHRAAAEGRAHVVVLDLRRDARRQHQGGHREAVAERLGAREHVGRDAVVVGRERRTGASHAALDLVEHQQRAQPVAALAQRLEHRLADIVGAAETLHGLDDDGGGVPVDVLLERCRIVARREAHVERPVRKPIPLLERAPGHRAGGGGSAVPAVLERDGLAASGDLERELQRVLVGLRAGIDEEHRVEAEIRELHQPRRGARAHRERQRVGLKAHLPRLALERRHPARVAVAEARDGVAAVEIEDLASVARMQPHAFAVRDLDRELREDLREMAFDGGHIRSSRARGR